MGMKVSTATVGSSSFFFNKTPNTIFLFYHKGQASYASAGYARCALNRMGQSGRGRPGNTLRVPTPFCPSYPPPQRGG